MTSTSPNATALRATNLAVREAAWWALVCVAVVGTGWLTLQSPQLGATVALVTLGAGLYAANRTAGLSAMWLVWLLVPLIRRMLGMVEPLSASDPLSLAPFLLTGLIVCVEVVRAELSRFATTVVLLATCGYLIGVPSGLGSASSMAFALLAYVVAVGCFVIGYREPPQLEGLTARRMLMLAVPPVALYSVYQYFGPLPDWDASWLFSVQDTLNSVGSPEEGRIRVWGTLNSPGTFSAVLALTAICYIAGRRLGPFRLLALALVLLGLLLTFVRGAWVSVVIAALVVALASRGRATGRLLLVGGMLVLALAQFGAQGGTGEAILGRADTLGNLNSDISARARVATPLEYVPEAVATPLGHGLGSAGEASKLSTSSPLRNTDNGYLSLVYQAGPLGFLLVLGVMAATMLRAVGNLARHGSAPVDVAVIGLLSYLFIGMFFGDLLYGLPGMIFWYVLGVAARRGEQSE